MGVLVKGWTDWNLRVSAEVNWVRRGLEGRKGRNKEEKE